MKKKKSEVYQSFPVSWLLLYAGDAQFASGYSSLDTFVDKRHNFSFRFLHSMWSGSTFSRPAFLKRDDVFFFFFSSSV